MSEPQKRRWSSVLVDACFQACKYPERPILENLSAKLLLGGIDDLESELTRLRAECDALRAENEALKKQPARVSLLRKPVKHISELGPCHCPPDVCSAPVIMGVQTPCLRHVALKEVDRE